MKKFTEEQAMNLLRALFDPQQIQREKDIENLAAETVKTLPSWIECKRDFAARRLAEAFLDFMDDSMDAAHAAGFLR